MNNMVKFKFRSETLSKQYRKQGNQTFPLKSALCKKQPISQITHIKRTKRMRVSEEYLEAEFTESID